MRNTIIMMVIASVMAISAPAHSMCLSCTAAKQKTEAYNNVMKGKRANTERARLIRMVGKEIFDRQYDECRKLLRRNNTGKSMRFDERHRFCMRAIQ